MALGQSIYRLRRARDWKQADLAARLGVSQTHVTRWESGKVRPRARMVEKLAEVFGVTVEELLAGDPRTESRNGLAKIQDPELLQQLAQIHRLEDKDQEALKRILGAMLTRVRLADVVNG